MGVYTVKALLNILVVDVVGFFNIGKNMDAPQVIQTVELILEEYPYFKPEDFKLCFNRAKKGQYGKLYDRLDGQVILDWLTVYDLERTMEVEAIRAKENRQLKQLAGTPLILDTEADEYKANEVFKANMLQLRETLANNKKAKLEAESVRTANRALNKGPVYEMHQIWLKQFDTLWKRQGYPPSRLVRKYGRINNPGYFPNAKPPRPKTLLRMLNVNEYLEHKQWQYTEFAVKGRKLYEVR